MVIPILSTNIPNRGNHRANIVKARSPSFIGLMVVRLFRAALKEDPVVGQLKLTWPEAKVTFTRSFYCSRSPRQGLYWKQSVIFAVLYRGHLWSDWTMRYHTETGIAVSTFGAAVHHSGLARVVYCSLVSFCMLVLKKDPIENFYFEFYQIVVAYCCGICRLTFYYFQWQFHRIA